MSADKETACQKKVSVVMTSYNGARFISEQIQSILPQLGESDELIISDDCSTDDTVALIRSFNDSRIRLFQNSVNVGLGRNIAQCMNRANGELIFFCDQDDIWEPDKVEKCRSALMSHDLVIHNGIFMDKRGQQQNRTIFQYRYPVLNYWKNLIRNSCVGACMALRRDLLKMLLPIPEDIPMHDWYIFLCALRMKKRIKVVGDKLILYRRHGGNSSPTGNGKSPHSLPEMLSWRWKLLLKTLPYRAEK